MSDDTVKAKVKIVNPQGMHLRPADLFARTVMKYNSEVSVNFGGQIVDGRSIVELLMMAARQGSELEIAVKGTDAREALAALVQLVEQGFGEMNDA